MLKVNLANASKLHHCENPWKSRRIGTGSVDLDLLKKFRALLNKITPSNFQRITDQILSLEVTTYRELQSLTDLLYNRAVTESLYVVTYAYVMHKMSWKFQVTVNSISIPFRKIILVTCQKVFQSFVDEKTITRQMRLGNIRLIGELYKLQMLTGKIMHDCIVSLLESTDEVAYECVCVLLKTCGKFLDQPKAQNLMNQYFAKMKELSENPRKASNRIRFALKDIIELRENSWKPRREDNNPKTIAEVHAKLPLKHMNTGYAGEVSHNWTW
ncbi:Eif4g [Bugula neritina]|uniref:Eif4g n=1 Tax=Bugula neritina TaxID=10212 RepID=A0A7J7J8R5_BUGNE|nr:Eif4g [Bugula neritina]